MSMLKAEGVNPRDATVLILVDSIQKLSEVDQGLLRFAIDELCDVINLTDNAFVIACITGTFYIPLKNAWGCM